MTDPTPPSTAGRPGESTVLRPPATAPGATRPVTTSAGVTPGPFVPPAQAQQPSPQLMPKAAVPMPARPTYRREPATRNGPFGTGFGAGLGAALGIGTAMLALGVLTLVGLMSMSALLSAGRTATAGSTDPNVTTIWGPATATKTLRAVYVSGPILGSASDGVTLSGGTYGFEVADMIDKLGKDDAVGLVLIMNTPGGTIYGSRAIADAVARYKERTGHKVLAYVGGMSASGGMFAMSGADHIVADYGTLVGSIGVIAGPFERYKDVKAVNGGLLGTGVDTTGGITYEYLTQGKGKDFGSPYRDMNAEERKVFTDGMAREYDQFVSYVAAGRKLAPEKIKGELGAYLYDAATAKDKGLVDAVSGRDAAFRKAAELNGADPNATRLVAATPPSFLQQLLGAEARTYGTAPAAVPMGGQPARATAPLCTGAMLTMAWHGDLSKVCG